MDRPERVCQWINYRGRWGEDAEAGLKICLRPYGKTSHNKAVLLLGGFYYEIVLVTDSPSNDIYCRCLGLITSIFQKWPTNYLDITSRPTGSEYIYNFAIFLKDVPEPVMNLHLSQELFQ